LVQIFLNGYGNIGRRLATAFSKDKSIELIGIAKYSADNETEKALEKGYKVFVPKEMEKEFKSKNYNVTGNIEDAIKQADIIIDAAREGKGFQNKQKSYFSRR
jgi:glyceraldehyde-3-phosphate dehydrogenase (NAD(P))